MTRQQELKLELSSPARHNDMKDGFLAEPFFALSEAEELIEVWWD